MSVKKNLALTLLWLCCFQLFGAVRLPKLVSDGMVLQRDAAVKIWGWADAGEAVSVTFRDTVFETTTGDSGIWAIHLSPLKAGGPYSMTIAGTNSITIRDILVGDVWLCSGQSNMELNLARASPLYPEEIAKSENPFIRYFEVPKRYDFNTPQQEIPGGQWISINPQTILKCSAVAYFFALDLYEKYQIPIGLINASLGGSPVEAWISEGPLKAFPEYYNEALRFRDPQLIRSIETQNRERSKQWYSALWSLDEGYRNPDTPWFSQKLQVEHWSEMDIPGYWANEALGPVHGAVWFRKEITLGVDASGAPAKLLLGRIVDADSVFVNGVLVGTTSYQYPPRRYEIPAGLLKAGANTLVIRVINSGGKGGFVPDKPYSLTVAGKTIDLKGPWKYKLGAEMPALEPEVFIRWKPLGLFNAMIAPVVNYRIKGVIWYQGESNAERPNDYLALFSAMITDWRAHWRQPDLPFLYVQLANFLEARAQPVQSNWALLREAQLKALVLPHTGMAVTIDIGEWNDIHPLNKKDVGQRLSLVAQKVAYGNEQVVSSGPLYQSMKIQGDTIELSFKNTGSGLVSRDGQPLAQFAIAGSDGVFVWANARILENKVLVWSNLVSQPRAVRYAWADNPEGANLYNQEGLPASPFRTDQ
ncbi:MAG: sialate O-acetylesterase [Lewinellaceae bacterium]|nr:sialate O-acetylesterase [Lewinellaceae bacterium]